MSGDVSSMPPGSVVITPTDMYTEIRSMTKTLDHLVAVIDPALSDIRNDIAEVRTTQQDHESRLRSLDKRVWAAAVVAAGFSSGITQAITAISS